MKKSLHKLHNLCCERYPLYAAWHEHPYANSTHWYAFFLFLLGWTTAIVSVITTIWFLPQERVYAAAGQNVTQIHYRWRNDDGTEAAATFAAAEDTANTVIAKSTTIRLRTEVSNKGSADATAASYRLQYARLTSGICSGIAEGNWVSIPTTVSASEHWQLADSSNLTNAAATTNVASGLTDDNTTFVAGTVQDTTTDTTAITFTSTQFTEIEHALQATTNAVDKGNYCFRFIDADQAPSRSTSVSFASGVSGVFASAIDTTNGFAYFGTQDNPTKIVKVQLSDFSIVSTLTLNAGENTAYSMVIDTTNGFLYVGTQTAPGIVVKINLSNFTRTGALTLNTGENYLHTAVIDGANGFAYFGTDSTNPSIIIKVQLSDFTRSAALTLNSGEGNLEGSAIDTTNGFAYFVSKVFPGNVIKVQLSNFTRSAALALNNGTLLRNASIDTQRGFLYTSTTNSPARIRKIQLSDFTDKGTLTLSSGEDNVIAHALDITNGFGYFVTSASPGRVTKVDLATFLRVGSLTLATGENTTQTVLFDATKNFLYPASSWTTVGIVVKVDTRNILDTYTVYPQATINNAPTVTTPISIAQATTGTGYVTFQTTVADTDADAMKMKVELYDGTTFVVVPAASLSITSATNSTGITVATEGSNFHVQGVSTAANNTLMIRIATKDIANLANARRTDVQIRVTPNDGTGTGSAQTSSAFTVDNAAPIGLASLAAGTATRTTMPLTWIAATDSGTFDHYEIWYGTTQADVQNRTGTATEWDGDNDVALATAATTGTTLIKLTPRLTYFLKIWAIDSFTNEATIADISVNTQAPPTAGALIDQTPPGEPAGFTVTKTDVGAVLLRWKDPSDTDFSSIVVLRGEGLFPISGDVYAVVLPGVQYYIDTKVTAGSTYHYLLKAFDGVGNFSLTTYKQSITLPVPTLIVAEEAKTSVVVVPTSLPPMPENAISTVPLNLNLKELIRMQHPSSTGNAENDACTNGQLWCSTNRLFTIERIPGLTFLINRLIPERERQETFRTVERTVRGGLTIIGRFGLLYDLVPDGSVPGASFATPVTITLRYNPRDADLILRPEHSLVLVYFDVLRNAWELVTGARQDTVKGVFTARVSKAGTYGIVIVKQAGPIL